LRLCLRLAAKERAAKALLRIYYEVLIDLEVRKDGISTKWNNGLGANLTYIDLYRSIEIDQKFVFARLKL